MAQLTDIEKGGQVVVGVIAYQENKVSPLSAGNAVIQIVDAAVETGEWNALFVPSLAGTVLLPA